MGIFVRNIMLNMHRIVGRGGCVVWVGTTSRPSAKGASSNKYNYRFCNHIYKVFTINSYNSKIKWNVTIKA